MDGKDIISFLDKHKEELEKYGVKNIGLFGSYAKNKNDENSDIDILVEFKEGNKTFDNYMDLKFYLEDTFNKKIDLVIDENIKKELRDDILGSARYV